MEQSRPVESSCTLRSATQQRWIIVVCQVAALTCWFSASAVASQLQARTAGGQLGAILLTSSVQAGFVIGAITFAILNLPDRLRPTRLYAVCCLVAATCTILMLVVPPDLSKTVALRACTGIAMAGIYPVGLKLTASWAGPHERARALGLLVGGLTLGSATPHLIRGVDGMAWQSVLSGSAFLCLGGGLCMWLAVDEGPNLDSRRAKLNARFALAVFRQALPRLVNVGYLGHMWELYALWTWLPTFLVASHAMRGLEDTDHAYLIAFLAIGVAGFAGCLFGGVIADRVGRPVAAIIALSISGACCALSPFLFGANPVLLTIFVLIWGAAVIADSGVFSAALSEVIDQRYVGTALTTQTSIGFLLTIVSIHLVPELARLTSWRFAFLILALGPLSGVIAMRRFNRRMAELPAVDPLGS